MRAYTQIKSRQAFQNSPVQEGHALLFLQSDSGQAYNIVAKKADGTFVQLNQASASGGVTQQQMKDTALIYALVFG